MITVVLTGPESSGKTVLAEKLAIHFNSIFVPEYLRSYFDKKKAVFEEKMPKIAQKQLNNEQNGRKMTKNILFLDTNILTLKVYHELYFKSKPMWFDTMWQRKRYDHYLLLKPDIPWIDDGQRDMRTRRNEIFDLFEKELKSVNAGYSIISGTFEERFSQAVKIVEDLLIGGQ